VVVFDIITVQSPGSVYLLLQKPHFFFSPLCVILKNVEA